MALKRHGRFVVVRPMVTTSARKAEFHNFWATMWLFMKLLVRAPFGVRKREHASFWYDGKR
jgi:hypothetical protein